MTIQNHDPASSAPSAETAGREMPRDTSSDLWHDLGQDFVLIDEIQPPGRIALARERLLMCRLYLGLIRTINEDYGSAFVAHSDSASFRAVGIYVLLRTLMCTPVHASTIAHALKLPRATVLRRLQEMIKNGYVERVGNAYRATDKVNIPDLKNKVQRRIEMITDTVRKLAELNTASQRQ